MKFRFHFFRILRIIARPVVLASRLGHALSNSLPLPPDSQSRTDDH